METGTTRLNKYLSEIGYCSRRAADKLIEEKRILVNDELPQMGQKVSPDDQISVDGEQIQDPKREHVYLAFNKPVGVVCTTDLREKDNIIDFINYPQRIFPIGRLDKPSEGLILLTSDGDVVNKILRSRYNHEKEYIVTVDKLITPDFIQRMGNGIPILDTVTKKCVVEEISKFSFRIILTQGLNRQIRRMCDYLGYEVVKLKRVRIMNIKLQSNVGEYVLISQKEMFTNLKSDEIEDFIAQKNSKKSSENDKLGISNCNKVKKIDQLNEQGRIVKRGF
ncbi:pseudouridine synthase [Aquimarina agarilytica]|uniref:pseudouridine synthase n=1 Tax=Aquimarina agarilytica TaxID=1087449 RepID=UPI000289C56E|nr:pseudouridine synthase [Aquimarina agarilytica]